MTTEADTKRTEPEPKAAGVGKFFSKYPTFISSIIIGIAGLCATSIWQYRQSETTRKQAEAQVHAAETAAENSWKIERADILSKNLGVLAQTGSATADQRYGVLLSLARADIIDPELAVSYALELGKDNADYMTSVLATEPAKDWQRLARAYVLSCDERFGISPGIDACADKLAARSTALGALVASELGDGSAGGAGSGSDAANSPLVLLANERAAQLDVQLLVGLFGQALTEWYDRRQFDQIDAFEASSPGAHLVASLALGAARTGEFVPDDEASQLEQFHVAQTKWLSGYLLGKTCDAECKGRVVEVMLTKYLESAGDYNAAMVSLLASPPSQAHVATSKLHARLLWCQADDGDVAALRDGALVPALAAVLAAPKSDPSTRDALISLLALVPEPAAADASAGGDADAAKASAAWTKLIAQLATAPGKPGQLLDARRAAVAKQRKSPPFALRQTNFCTTAAPTP